MVKAKVIAGVVAAVVAAVLVVTLSITLTRDGSSPEPITAASRSTGSSDTASAVSNGSAAPGNTTEPTPPPPTPNPPATPTPPANPPPVTTVPAPAPAMEPAADDMNMTLLVPAATAPEVDLEAATAPAPAPEAAGDMYTYFHWAGPQCPAVGGPGYATTVGTPAGNPFFAMKDEMKEYYAGPGKHVEIVNGKIKLDYQEVANGDTYCDPAPGKKVLVGGTILFKKGDTCSLPPTKANGAPCCYMKIWQPNNEGFYENACSSQIDIGGDGTWWLYTEHPGDETNGGYADDQAHLHYDVRCTACDTGPFTTLNTERGEGWWNKWWQEQVCTAPQCGKTGPQHESIEKTVMGGINTFKYHTVIVYQ